MFMFKSLHDLINVMYALTLHVLTNFVYKLMTVIGETYSLLLDMSLESMYIRGNSVNLKLGKLSGF